VKRGKEVLRVRQLLAAALLLFDAYVQEGLGTKNDRDAAAVVISALLAEVREGLQHELRGQ